MPFPELDELPKIGLGTWQITAHDQCVETVRNALDIGYRHVDTARMYENEAAVGEAIAESDVDRQEVFLATKLNVGNYERDDVLDSSRESLDRLRTDYVDLLYVHWPAGEYDPHETLGALRELRDEGVTRYIGLSNFTPELLREAREAQGETFYALQVEMHPYLPQDHLRKEALDHDLNLVAYSPFRHGTIFDEPVVETIAEETGGTPAQVLLAWLEEKE